MEEVEVRSVSDIALSDSDYDYDYEDPFGDMFGDVFRHRKLSVPTPDSAKLEPTYQTLYCLLVFPPEPLPTRPRESTVHIPVQAGSHRAWLGLAWLGLAWLGWLDLA